MPRIFPTNIFPHQLLRPHLGGQPRLPRVRPVRVLGGAGERPLGAGPPAEGGEDPGQAQPEGERGLILEGGVRAAAGERGGADGS